MPAEHQGSRLLPLLDGLQHINDDAFKRALQVIVSSAKTVDEAQKNIEDWFDKRMSQLSDVYKSKLIYLSAIIGLVLTLALNTDTLQIARALWDDPALREAAVSAAQTAVNSGQLEALIPPTAVPTATLAPTPAGTQEAAAQALAAEATATPEPTETATPADIGGSVETAQQTVNQLIGLNLPIGWEFTPITAGCHGVDTDPTDCQSMRNIWLFSPVNNPTGWLGLLIRKVVGIAVTVIAVMQGAPFWFDLLRRLVQRN